MLVVLLALACAFSVFSACSAVNYAEIAETKLLLGLDVVPRVTLVRAQNGTIEQIELFLNITVSNPGPKGVDFWAMGYKGWVRDYEAEAVPDTERIETDGRTHEGNATILWAPVFAIPIMMEEHVPPKQASTFLRTYTFYRPGNESIFLMVEGIAHYAEGLGIEELEWRQFVSANLYVSGVQRHYAGYGAYLRELPFIKRWLGWDLTPGSGGLG
ncbi:MAG: hypothetical protein AB1665_01720 [Candidatus Thermoplasmatota archaeon]